jgi:hypothetical protein
VALSSADPRLTVEHRDAWWQWIRRHCLADDTYWHIEGRFYDEPEYAKVFYRQGVSAWFLRTLVKRRTLGAVNMITFGQQRSAKSMGTLYIAERLDPTFAPNLTDRVFFRLSLLRRAVEQVPPNSIVVCDEVRRTFGVGSKNILLKIANFLETKAKKGVSVFFDTPTLKLEEIIHGLFYAIEYYGYDVASQTSMAMLYSIRHRLEPIGLIFPGLPSPILLAAYTPYKDHFVAETSTPSADYADEIQLLTSNPLWERVRDRRSTAQALAQVLLPEETKDVVRSIAILAIAQSPPKPREAPPLPSAATEPDFLGEEPLPPGFIDAMAEYLSTKYPPERVEWFRRYAAGESLGDIGKHSTVGDFIKALKEEQLGYAGEYAEHKAEPEWEWGGGNTDAPDFVDHRRHIVISFKTSLGSRGGERRDRPSAQEVALVQAGYTGIVKVADLRAGTLRTYKMTIPASDSASSPVHPLSPACAAPEDAAPPPPASHPIPPATRPVPEPEPIPPATPTTDRATRSHPRRTTRR